MKRLIIAAMLAASAIGGTAAVAHAQPAEDSPGWSCVDAPRHVCGPASDDYGHTPGCYDDGGVFVAPWPCHVVVNRDGSADIYSGPEPRQ